MKPFFKFFLFLLLASCGNASNENGNAGDTANTEGAHAGAKPTGVIGSKPMVLAGCYEMTIKRDTATLNLQVQDTAVSGNLQYRWAEKDGNTGTIKGVLRDSLIIADYTFQSEGTTSVREVVFKIHNNTLVQAFGQLIDQAGKIVFIDRAGLQYMHENPFVKVPCP